MGLRGMTAWAGILGPGAGSWDNQCGTPQVRVKGKGDSLMP